MDWSVFWGIAASIALGAVTYFITNIFTDYIKRRYLIIGLKHEIQQNVERMEYLRDLYLNEFVETINLNPLGIPPLLYKIDNIVYKNYYNDLKLLIDESLVNKIMRLYSQEYILESFKTEMEFYIIEDNKSSQQIKKDLEKLKNDPVFNKEYNNLVKIFEESDKHLLNISKIMQKFVSNFNNDSQKIIESLDKLYKLNFCNFFIRYFIQYRIRNLKN